MMAIAMAMAMVTKILWRGSAKDPITGWLSVRSTWPGELRKNLTSFLFCLSVGGKPLEGLGLHQGACSSSWSQLRA